MTDFINITVPEQKLCTFPIKKPEEQLPASAFAKWKIVQVDVDGLKQSLLELNANLKPDDVFNKMLEWWGNNDKEQNPDSSFAKRYLYERIIEMAEKDDQAIKAGERCLALAILKFKSEGFTSDVLYWLQKSKIKAEAHFSPLVLMKLARFYQEIGKRNEAREVIQNASIKYHPYLRGAKL